MKQTKERFDKLKALFKKNYDAGLGYPLEFIHEDDYCTSVVTQKNLKDHRNNLAPIV